MTPRLKTSTLEPHFVPISTSGACDGFIRHQSAVCTVTSRARSLALHSLAHQRRALGLRHPTSSVTRAGADWGHESCAGVKPGSNWDRLGAVGLTIQAKVP